jgi:hypothetical protein
LVSYHLNNPGFLWKAFLFPVIYTLMYRDKHSSNWDDDRTSSSDHQARAGVLITTMERTVVTMEQSLAAVRESLRIGVPASRAIATRVVRLEEILGVARTLLQGARVASGRLRLVEVPEDVINEFSVVETASKALGRLAWGAQSKAG